MTIEDILDNTTHNINALSEDNINKLQHESTNTSIPCTNPILVRIDEFQTNEIASTEEQQQNTNTMPLIYAKDKEKELHEQIKDMRLLQRLRMRIKFQGMNFE